MATTNQYGQDRNPADVIGDPGNLAKDAPPPPQQPDYVGAAREQAIMGRTNQYTPFGNLTWIPGQAAVAAQPATSGGVEQLPDGSTREIPAFAGTPARPATPWSSVITLNPQAQRALSSQQRTTADLSELAGQQYGRVQERFSQPFDMSGVQDIADKAYAAHTSRLDPQWQQKRSMKETELRNQGLVAGGEAYEDAMRSFNQGETDAYQQARLGAISTMPQTFQLAQSAYREPLDSLNALTGAARIQNPQFMPNQPGENLLGALGQQGQFQMGQYGAQVGQANATNQMTGQLAAAAAMYFF